ncbi:GTP 3',8-cyclase MoaA [Aliikangiella coralliicola]|uniref:GTP 3',8-cyclase n=1 Tax=Aliikangiella coralliicola TaxID=2592383 RepID=A0A545UDI2_9GAMM|nr:GTP 3',8-cyclase MoaA [Aliikangiella coralliicola]TQV87525.1 GTP 3',8-cyclase MoaA [Aliikangiella coralliicola]
MSYQLIDPQGRQFPYLRLSVTDVCNFSCDYCLPDGYQCDSKKHFLTLPEIKNLVSAFAELGTWKIRLTGGEPSVRKDFDEIIKTIKAISGIKQIAMTTNGYKLKERIQNWASAGLTHLNVSVDSLDPKLFHSLTGHNRLKEILAGVDIALNSSIKRVKLNAVLLKNVNSHQLGEYTSLLKKSKLSMRFIELMQTGDNHDYFNRYHVSAQVLKNYLFANGWTEKLREPGAGPAIEYVHPDYQGTFGVIAPYSKDFCNTCNRLRVSSVGDFHLCLFGEHGFSVRHLLQSESQREELKQTLCRLLENKRKQHFLHDNNPGGTPHLASVGG